MADSGSPPWGEREEQGGLSWGGPDSSKDDTAAGSSPARLSAGLRAWQTGGWHVITWDGRHDGELGDRLERSTAGQHQQLRLELEQLGLALLAELRTWVRRLPGWVPGVAAILAPSLVLVPLALLGWRAAL